MENIHLENCIAKYHFSLSLSLSFPLSLEKLILQLLGSKFADFDVKDKTQECQRRCSFEIWKMKCVNTWAAKINILLILIILSRCCLFTFDKTICSHLNKIRLLSFVLMAQFQSERESERVEKALIYWYDKSHSVSKVHTVKIQMNCHPAFTHSFTWLRLILNG